MNEDDVILRLERIEAILMKLIELLADEDDEQPSVSLDGSVINRPRDTNQPL